MNLFVLFLFSYALVLKRLGLLNEALPYFVRTVKAVPHLWSAWEDLVMLIDSEQKVFIELIKFLLSLLILIF